jgi:flagellar biogenesis protein FliO
MDGRDIRAIKVHRLSGLAGGIKRGTCRAGSVGAIEAVLADGGLSGGDTATAPAAMCAEWFTNSLRLGGGSRIRRTLGAGVVLLAGLLLPAASWGQAMGRISLDGPSPLPLAPKVTEPDQAAAQKAVGISGSNAAAPVAAAGGTGTGEPDGNAVARGPAPLPEIKPPEPPKPANIPAVSSGTSAPVNAPPPVAVETGETKSVNDVEKQAIRSGASVGVGDAKNATADSTKGAGSTSVGGVGQVIAALAIVVGLIFIGRALVRKFVPGAGASNGKGVIEILARHPLTKNQSIVLVRIGSQIVALNQGKEASQSVLVLSEPIEVSRIIGQIEGKSPASMQAGFNRLLANARMDLENGEAEAAPTSLGEENLDEQLEEMAAAKRQLMELRQHVRTVRDSLPRE